MKSIFYKKGYKYQLGLDYVCKTSLRPENNIYTEFIELTVDGLLFIKKYYSWDGPSGPAIDTKNFMRGSLVHDVLYQLIREGRLDPDQRKAADLELKTICLEDGMSRIRAGWVYRGLRWGGGPAASPKNLKDIIKAP